MILLSLASRVLEMLTSSWLSPACMKTSLSDVVSEVWGPLLYWSHIPVPPCQQCITVIFWPQPYGLNKAKVELMVRKPSSTSTILREVLFTRESKMHLWHDKLCAHNERRDTHHNSTVSDGRNSHLGNAIQCGVAFLGRAVSSGVSGRGADGNVSKCLYKIQRKTPLVTV